MSISGPNVSGYEDAFDSFDSPLMQQLRREAYGKDIGQHSWVTAEELEQDIRQLELTRQNRLLDLGAGPCGPLAFIAGLVGCKITGVDVSAAALTAGCARIGSLGLQDSVALVQANLNDNLPFQSGSFDVVIALDVILHLRDRRQVFREVARLLTPGGRFLFSDAGVVTGPISSEDVQQRAVYGYIQFVPPGLNEALLETNGLRLLYRTDGTECLLKIATGRLAARLAHRTELERIEGHQGFERQLRYLNTVIDLAQKRSLSRRTYMAERGVSRVADKH